MAEFVLHGLGQRHLSSGKPEVLYLLAFSNFKLDKPQKAVSFFRACAALKSPFQQLATANLSRVKSQYTGIK